MITYIFKNEKIIKNILNNLKQYSIKKILSEILISSIDNLDENGYLVFHYS